MTTYNSYTAYKRDTRHLVYWIIRASNTIIKSLPNPEDDAPSELNTTGQITVPGLLSLSKLIAKHINPIPSTIYRLFQSVIEARTAIHEVFQGIVAKNPDAEIERSNASHKYFIDVLTEAFEALGGEDWVAKQKANSDKSEDKENLEQIIFTNKFNALNLRETKELSEEGDEMSDGEPDKEFKPVAAPRRRQQKKKSGKGKNGRGKKMKKKQKQAGFEERSLDDVPLESYRIIQDEDGIITDYLMAVYALVQEWADLRDYLQSLWHEVAYDGLNSAIAGTLCNVAITMVKQTQSAIFVDFPGHDSYETVMKTITRGDPEKAQTMFSAHILKISPDSTKVEVVQETKVDIKEQFSIHAYQDLLDFITDFQKTRSGKPTKRMLAEIRNWDPQLDLRQANKEQRIKWRRSYTINWLYDLVNVFSSIVVQRNTIKGENHDYAKVDWSMNGPWSVHRRLFGLNEFAGTITSLAMQQPNTDIRDKILPHHVFQLQSIVDSLTVSRGWSLSALRGHILSPPARGFRPRRDVDLFLDRNNEMIGSGYLNGVDVLRQLLERDSVLHADPNRHQALSELLQGVQEDFINWLGESKYMHGLQTIPPSRFSNTNGLWEYSPFLCGVGLMEGLEIAYLVNMKIWDRIPEPVLVIHLHNMLLQKGYITQPVGLYASLEELFPTAFFSAGKVPTSNFAGALLARINETGSRRLIFERKATARTAARSAVDIHGLLDVNANRFFRAKSTLTLYRQVDWDPERIADSDIRVTSLLGMARLGQKKQLIDPMTGERRLEDTELVNRARAQGMDEMALLDVSSLLGRLKAIDDVRLPETLLGSSSKGQRLSELSKRTGGATHPNDVHNDLNITGRKLLELLKWDIFADVCGEQPLSSLNYVWVTARFMMLFMQIEEELRRLKNPLYVRAYETEREWRWQKRVGLTMMALSEEDNECLQTMAREFQNPRVGFMNHIYWKDIEEMGTRIKSLNQGTKTNEGVDGCVVM